MGITELDSGHGMANAEGERENEAEKKCSSQCMKTNFVTDTVD